MLYDNGGRGARPMPQRPIPQPTAGAIPPALYNNLMPQQGKSPFAPKPIKTPGLAQRPEFTRTVTQGMAGQYQQPPATMPQYGVGLPRYGFGQQAPAQQPAWMNQMWLRRQGASGGGRLMAPPQLNNNIPMGFRGQYGPPQYQGNPFMPAIPY